MSIPTHSYNSLLAQVNKFKVTALHYDVIWTATFTAGGSPCKGTLVLLFKRLLSAVIKEHSLGICHIKNLSP